MSADGKRAIVTALADAVSAGVSVTFACQVLQIPRQRLYRWQRRLVGSAHTLADPLIDRAPGPVPGTAPHRLLAEEKRLIATLAREETYADLSFRQLAVVASEQGHVQVSATSFYRYAPQHRCPADRPEKTPVRQTKPVIDPTGPNQVWSWDLTYLPFQERFLYLVAILDVSSRKLVGWQLCLNATVEQVKQAWDLALSNEGLLEDTTPPLGLEALSDHGTQMTAHSMVEFFRTLGIDQLFARCQTPTDNAWIETWFRILKYDWLRFQDALTFHELEEVIAEFIEYYNHHRYHGAIGFVTPQQKHTGQDQQILQARRERKEAARQQRLAVHRQQTSRATDVEAA
jgi:putative transposase